MGIDNVELLKRGFKVTTAASLHRTIGPLDAPIASAPHYSFIHHIELKFPALTGVGC